MSEKDEVQPKAPEETAGAGKLPYRAPRLRKLGKVSELTDNLPPPHLGGIDGGSFPNMYMS